MDVSYSMVSALCDAFRDTPSEWYPIVQSIKGFIDNHSHKCKLYEPQYDFYSRWEAHRTLLEEEAKSNGTAIPNMPPVEDADMIQTFHDFCNLLDTFPLLKGNRIAPSNTPVDELRAYLTLRLKTVSLLRIKNKRKTDEFTSNRHI